MAVPQHVDVIATVLSKALVVNSDSMKKWQLREPWERAAPRLGLVRGQMHLARLLDVALLGTRGGSLADITKRPTRCRTQRLVTRSRGRSSLRARTGDP